MPDGRVNGMKNAHSDSALFAFISLSLPYAAFIKRHILNISSHTVPNLSPFRAKTTTTTQRARVSIGRRCSAFRARINNAYRGRNPILLHPRVTWDDDDDAIVEFRHLRSILALRRRDVDDICSSLFSLPLHARTHALFSGGVSRLSVPVAARGLGEFNSMAFCEQR